MATAHKRSRYTLQVRTARGMFLYNTLSGKGGLHPTEAATVLQRGEGTGQVFERLLSEGHLVPRERDELSLATRQQFAGTFRNDMLHLILFSTEQCNFRCVYCYEKFEHGAMRPWVRQGVKNLVARRASDLRLLNIAWFGGEPLMAPKVVLELSEHFAHLAGVHGFRYEAHATTNGYYLTPELVPSLLALGLRGFQITLDGPPEFHDAKRRMADGGPTFERIWENLVYLKSIEEPFGVTLRINLDQENVPQAQPFIRRLGETFGGDRRFRLHLHKVGRWGGSNDEALQVLPDENALPDLYAHGKTCGLDPYLGTGLNPFGSVCYAAKPYSFAIRADGRVNKCTIALDDERNLVGRLLPDGTLQLDQERLRPWIMENALSDTGCQACAIRPACQGAACPLERMNSGKRPCPDLRWHFKKYLPILLEPTQTCAD